MKRLFLVLVLGLCGCRDTEPPPTHNYNLGTPERPLLPTGRMFTDASVIAGSRAQSVELPPYREPGTAPPRRQGPQRLTPSPTSTDEHTDQPAPDEHAGDMPDDAVADEDEGPVKPSADDGAPSDDNAAPVEDAEGDQGEAPAADDESEAAPADEGDANSGEPQTDEPNDDSPEDETASNEDE